MEENFWNYSFNKKVIKLQKSYKIKNFNPILSQVCCLHVYKKKSKTVYWKNQVYKINTIPSIYNFLQGKQYGGVIKESHKKNRFQQMVFPFSWQNLSQCTFINYCLLLLLCIILIYIIKERFYYLLLFREYDFSWVIYYSILLLIADLCDMRSERYVSHDIKTP